MFNQPAGAESSNLPIKVIHRGYKLNDYYNTTTSIYVFLSGKMLCDDACFFNKWITPSCNIYRSPYM